jgi:hypothetical protein
MAKKFQKAKPIVPLLELFDRARKVKLFTISIGRLYDVQRIGNEEIFFLRLDAKSEEERSMNLKEAERAYEEIEDFATIKFKPCVPILNSQAKYLFINLNNWHI